MLENMALTSLPESTSWKIAKYLDQNKPPNWKTLTKYLPKEFQYNEKKIRSLHMKILSPQRSPTISLLKDLSRKGKSVQDFISFIEAIQVSSKDVKLRSVIDILENSQSMHQDLSPIIIVQPPKSEVFDAGSDVNIQCEVSGGQPLKYQWFKGKIPITGQTFRHLVMRNVQRLHCGYYTCQVSNHIGYVYTDWTKVDIVQPSFTRISDIVINHPVFITHPISVSCYVGDNIYLLSDAVGNPAPSLQWYKNGEQLLGQTDRQLKITQCIASVHQGSYYCQASNKHGSSKSLPAKVVITASVAPTQEADSKSPGTTKLRREVSLTRDPEFLAASPRDLKSINFNVDDYTDFPFDTSDITARGPAGEPVMESLPYIANPPTEKMALLIGNQNYHYSTQLGKIVHPIKDTKDIASSLKSIGFKVVSLVDVDLNTMKDALAFFFDILEQGTYAVFYFAGHGFEVNGDNYLMPVDASNRYHPDENMSICYVLEHMTMKKPQLSLLLIDCCRTEPTSDIIIIKTSPKKGKNALDCLPIQRKNVLIAYGCCSKGRVLESPQKENGFFALHLKRHLHKDIMVHEVLFKVSRGIDQEQIFDHATGRSQVVFVQGTFCDNLKLVDEIASHEPNPQALHWRQIHQPPQSPVTVLAMDDIEVNLIFSAEFSNVLQVQSNIKLTDNTKLNKLRFLLPEKFGNATVEVVKEIGKESLFRIWNLEHLDGKIMLNMVVMYTVDGHDEKKNLCHTIEEKPLFAKLIHKMREAQIDTLVNNDRHFSVTDPPMGPMMHHAQPQPRFSIPLNPYQEPYMIMSMQQHHHLSNHMPQGTPPHAMGNPPMYYQIPSGVPHMQDSYWMYHQPTIYNPNNMPMYSMPSAYTTATSSYNPGLAYSSN